VTAATTSRPAVSVDELQRAWAAVRAGDFRRDPTRAIARTTRRTARAESEWISATGERTVAVLGAAGSVGASTVALALGLAAPEPVRVVECCSVTTSGMAAASTAELGLHESGWRQGSRDHVMLERGSEPLVNIDDVPTPTPTESEHERRLTVLDVGWDLAQVLATGCWLGDATRSADALVVVTTATVPGMRRLEAALELLGEDRAVVAVVGLRRKKWPRGVEHSAGPATRRALAAERCVEIPKDRALAAAGLDSRPLPEPLLTAGRDLLVRLDLASPLDYDVSDA
jgi:hypothetical protein